MQPILAPGTHLLRRGPDLVQAGLDPDTAVVLPPSQPSDAPRDATAPGDAVTPRTVGSLLERGLALADDRALRAALPPVDAADPWPRHSVASLARRVGDRLEDTLDGRASWLVSVTPFGHPLATGLAADLEALCARAGLGLTRTGRGPGRPAPAALPVLVGVGEPSRDLADPWLRLPTPHLVVRLVEGAAVVGPFVQPGTTACLRCLDAYRTAEDPPWPLLVEQYARASRRDRADGIPEPVDPTLAAVALGWAARDLATYAEGGCPTTYGTTVRLSPALEAIETRAWHPHPECGCSWAPS